MPAQNRIATGPARVTLTRTEGKYRLAVNGEPFFVKGAGGGREHLDVLALRGANAIRTWSTSEAEALLDEAHAAGLMVLMGLRVVPGRHGFDYDDANAVARQLASLTDEVRAYKDHPALLAWGIGNELNLRSENPSVWNAVNDIAAMIHDVDANHPATTMLAGIAKPVVEAIAERAGELDFLCIQMYGNIVNAPRLIADSGYEGPYLFTEWGATGHWEVSTTDWGAPIEQTSSEKADAILERYRAAILGDPERCMGSFVFLWGQKQERTPTWYGLFTEEGEQTEAIDAMQHVWTGSWPEHRAPRLTEVSVDGKGRYDDVRLKAGRRYTAAVSSDDESGTPPSGLRVRAEILPEATELGEGGDYEPRPGAVAGLIDEASPQTIVFSAPSDPGPYRLLVYLLDAHGNAATANLPFLVE